MRTMEDHRVLIIAKAPVGYGSMVSVNLRHNARISGATLPQPTVCVYYAFPELTC